LSLVWIYVTTIWVTLLWFFAVDLSTSFYLWMFPKELPTCGVELTYFALFTLFYSLTRH
jgi:hypothetical protein